MHIDFGRPVYFLGPARHRFVIVDVRAVAVTVLACALTVAAAVYALTTGDAALPIRDVVSALTGSGSPYTTMIVVEWRLPRVLMALVIGACLATSGALFQSLTDNPLGSPDVIGFQTGAYTGAIITMLLLGGGTTATMAGALLGGSATALLVLALARHHGQVRGLRLIIVGIAVSAMLASVNTWILLTASVENAIMASLWGAGTLAGSSWPVLSSLASVAAVLLACTALLVRPLMVLQLGAQLAHGLGVNVGRLQIAAILVGIGLIAMPTATAGPISFIALAAPQIARRLVRSTGLLLSTSAAVGAFVLILADTLAQRIVSTSPLPVGLLTVGVGGTYFFWLLIREGIKR